MIYVSDINRKAIPRIIRGIAYYIILLALLSCENTEKINSSAEPETEDYLGFETYIKSVYMFVNDSAEIRILGVLPSGEKEIIDNSLFSWKISDPDTAVISTSGLLTALQEGSINVTADIEGCSLSKEIHICDCSKIMFSEIFYDPAGSDESEFIEIHNGNSLPCDISNFKIGDCPLDDTLFAFPANTKIPGDSFITITRSNDAFHSSFGFYPDYYKLPFALNNSGETVFLCGRDDSILDIVYIKGGHPKCQADTQWCSTKNPSAAEGKSIQRINFVDTNTCSDWTNGLPTPGY